MNYGVVIVTYNRLELLKECINAVENQVIKPHKIVVVNNNSTDGTKEFLETKKNENFIVENVTENNGSSYGFSRGVEILRKQDVDWQLIIDDDAIIDKEYILNISKYINKKYQAYSGVVLQNERPALLHRRRLKISYTKPFIPVSETEYNKDTFEYNITSFCGLLISNEIARKIDLPKRELFTQFTDTEYSLRLQKLTNVLNINSAKLIHKVNPSGKMKVWKVYYTIRNETYIMKSISKNKFCFSIVTIINAISMIFKYIFKRILLKEEKQKKYIKAVIYGKIDGLKGNFGKNDKFIPGLKL